MSSGTAPATGSAASSEPQPLYGGTSARRLTVRDVGAAKARGERWPMLTAYDQYAAAIFDQAGIPVLLVGDSAANNVLGYENTRPGHGGRARPVRAGRGRGHPARARGRRLPLRVVRGLAPAGAGDRRALPQGGRRAGGEDGGRRTGSRPRSRRWSARGSRSWAHIGLTPQSVNVLGGYRVQGRGEAGEQLLARRQGARARRGVRGGARGGAGRPGQAGHRDPDHPDHRHRRRQRDRRAGAGLAGPRSASTPSRPSSSSRTPTCAR